jgi:hypothetical protein
VIINHIHPATASPTCGTRRLHAHTRRYSVPPPFHTSASARILGPQCARCASSSRSSRRFSSSARPPSSSRRARKSTRSRGARTARGCVTCWERPPRNTGLETRRKADPRTCAPMVGLNSAQHADQRSEQQESIGFFPVDFPRVPTYRPFIPRQRLISSCTQPPSAPPPPFRSDSGASSSRSSRARSSRRCSASVGAARRRRRLRRTRRTRSRARMPRAPMPTRSALADRAPHALSRKRESVTGKRSIYFQRDDCSDARVWQHFRMHPWFPMVADGVDRCCRASSAFESRNEEC